MRRLRERALIPGTAVVVVEDQVLVELGEGGFRPGRIQTGLLL